MGTNRRLWREQHDVFDSGERQRLVMHIMEHEVEWKNEDYDFGLYKKRSRTYHLHLDLVDSEQGKESRCVPKTHVCDPICF